MLRGFNKIMSGNKIRLKMLSENLQRTSKGESKSIIGEKVEGKLIEKTKSMNV